MSIKQVLFSGFFFLITGGCLAQAHGVAGSHNKNRAGSSLTASLNGQWRGYFNSNGDIVATASDNIEYVLEINVDGTNVNGYSYSYFQDRSYYVICSVSGKLDKASKTITVTETARIKGVTPPGWEDCLQVHILTYTKEGKTEELAGSWKMAPGQSGNCGFGSTTLTRKTLSSDLASYNKSKNNLPFSVPRHSAPSTPIANKNKIKTAPPKIETETTVPNTETTVPPSSLTPVTKEAPQTTMPAPTKPTESTVAADINFEKRNTNLLQTINIDNPTFRVDLYDNGVIDGDSISLFYDNKLILSHQRLSDKAISLTLSIDKPTNELTMYAENLGLIPPNTALMVVTDGDNRYEVPVTSDLKNSGTIRFTHNTKNQ